MSGRRATWSGLALIVALIATGCAGGSPTTPSSPATATSPPPSASPGFASPGSAPPSPSPTRSSPSPTPNGPATASPILPSPSPLPSPTLDVTSVEVVGEAIAVGLRDGDTVALAGLMRSPFVIGYWAAEGFEREPAAAAVLLLDEVGPGVAARPDVDPASVVGPGWQGMFGPSVDVEAGIVLAPWSPDGRGAAVAYLVRATDGRLSWHGIVIDRYGS